jgi:hypothetical protein
MKRIIHLFATKVGYTPCLLIQGFGAHNHSDIKVKQTAIRITDTQRVLRIIITLIVICLTQDKISAEVLTAGKPIVVNNTSDNGPGSLREAIANAQPGDSIIFDVTVFSPSSPDTILLNSELYVGQGNLIIDASNAGVVLNRNGSLQDFFNGILITSNNNVIRGLQIFGFSNGIALVDGAQNNIIGGEHAIGSNPFGQGNLISNCEVGIVLGDEGTSFNTVKGNFIGTDLTGTSALGGKYDGIQIFSATSNTIEGNLIGGFPQYGIYIANNQEGNNTVRGNYIGTDFSITNDIGNDWAGIALERAGSNIIGPANVIGNTRNSGIWIMEVESKGNTIQGNYIGTDEDGSKDIGNDHNGILIDNSGYNEIGPGNMIAFNKRNGILVQHSHSVGNRITRNSIFKNQDLGIDVWDGGNKDLNAPFIFDINNQAGTLSGAACANCIVEVFSNDTDEGEFYEGTTTADEKGIFNLNNGSPFSKAHISATATDEAGNTSPFSVSTITISDRKLLIQEGNYLPKVGLQPKHSGDLEDNRIGGISELKDPDLGEEDTGGWDHTEVFPLGLKGARIGFNGWEWGVVDWSRPEAPSPSVHANRLVSNGMKLNYVLSFWDVANHPDGWVEDPPFSRFQNEVEIQRYLDFVRTIVNHFKDQIQYYEIWNEPDNDSWPVQHIKVSDYINLVERTVPIIRQEYPLAKIVVGSNILHSNPDYIFGIIESEAIMPLVDVISWHPLYDIIPADESVRDYYYEYPLIAQEIMDISSQHGFKGEYRADEVGWNDLEKFTPRESAKYFTRGIMLHLGMDIEINLGPPNHTSVLPFYTIRNLCTVMSGASTDSIPMEIQTTVSELRSCSFSLESGDKMFAIWNDNIAVDYDPGVKSTLTIPGLINQRMNGIDVLNGFEQELITEIQDSNMIIRDLMIKDYPIILRTASLTGINIPEKPEPSRLRQNYPNPFKDQTTITYELWENAHVSLKVYNIFGQLVETAINEIRPAGSYTYIWNSKNVEPGVYFYQIETSEFREAKMCVKHN